jgi:hypothetical protein
MEGIIYIAGALVFGIAYALLKPIVDGSWLVAIAVAYFGLLRLIGHYAAKYALRRAIGRAGSKQK